MHRLAEVVVMAPVLQMGHIVAAQPRRAGESRLHARDNETCLTLGGVCTCVCMYLLYTSILSQIYACHKHVVLQYVPDLNALAPMAEVLPQ